MLLRFKLLKFAYFRFFWLQSSLHHRHTKRSHTRLDASRYEQPRGSHKSAIVRTKCGRQRSPSWFLAAICNHCHVRQRQQLNSRSMVLAEQRSLLSRLHLLIRPSQSDASDRPAAPTQTTRSATERHGFASPATSTAATFPQLHKQLAAPFIATASAAAANVFRPTAATSVAKTQHTCSASPSSKFNGKYQLN